jgi:hypothetical protein
MSITQLSAMAEYNSQFPPAEQMVAYFSMNALYVSPSCCYCCPSLHQLTVTVCALFMRCTFSRNREIALLTSNVTTPEVVVAQLICEAVGDRCAR